MTLSKLLTCALLALSLTACGGDDSSSNNANNTNNTTNNTTNNVNGDPATLGKAVYDANQCAGCHGAEGKGGFGNNLTLPLTQNKSDEELADIIANGVPPNMVAYKNLGDEKIAQLVAYIRTLD